MFDEPSEEPIESSNDPATRAREKSDEFRTHAERAAVFEAKRKFDARLISGLDPEIAREVQRTIAKLEKAKTPESPVLPETAIVDATTLLNLFESRGLSTSDYHIHRRPGEVMIVRWISGDEVETFYERFQAHFDAAMEGFVEEERSEQEWKQDPQTLAYLDALGALKIKMADRYLRDPIRQHNLFVLSTQSADEMNIAYVCDYLMGVEPADLVGRASAPPEEASESDLAWFFKLFSLRGMVDGVERMCFFAFLQKTDDAF